MWRAETGKQVAAFEHWGSFVLDARFDATEARLVTVAVSGLAWVWSLAQRVPLRIVYGITPDVVSNPFLLPQNLLALTSTGGELGWWESATFLRLAVWAGALADAHNQLDQGLALNDLAVCCEKGPARVWNLSSGTVMALLRDPAADEAVARAMARGKDRYHAVSRYDRVESVAIHPNGSLVALGGSDGVTRVWQWSPTSGDGATSLVAKLVHPDDDDPNGARDELDVMVRDVLFIRDGALLVTAAGSHLTAAGSHLRVRVWDVADWSLCASWVFYECPVLTTSPCSVREGSDGWLWIVTKRGVRRVKIPQ